MAEEEEEEMGEEAGYLNGWRLLSGPGTVQYKRGKGLPMIGK